MFGSRKSRRRPYTSATSATVDPNAATAAASAFHLSSAAAAAAIRAIPLAPTNVAEVQTARTLRRSASVSSQGSRRGFSPVPTLRRGKGAAGGAPTLRRKGSASSMSERSFRSVSPHHARNAAAAIAAASVSSLPAGHDRTQSVAASAAAAATLSHSHSHSQSLDSRSRSVPPVPSVPRQMEPRKPAHLEMAQLSMRVASQQPKAARGSWFGGAVVSDYAQEGRPSSRSSSINFSYPSRARVGSPPPTNTAQTEPAAAVVSVPIARPPVRSASTERTAKSSLGRMMSHRRSASTSRATAASSRPDQTLVYDPNSRRMVPRAELLFMEQEVLEMEEQTRQRRKKAVPSHTSAHTTRATTTRTLDAAASPKRHESSPRHPVSVPASSLPAVRSPPLEQHKAPASEPIQSPAVEVPAEVPAERELDEFSQPPPALSTSTSTPSSSVSSLAVPQIAAAAPIRFQTEKKEDSRIEAPRTEEVARPSLVKRPSLVQEEPEREKEEEEQRHQQPQSATVELQRGTETRETRQEQSVVEPSPERRQARLPDSAARTAHFAPTSGGLTVQRYSPPPRSISPRKSAMKHANSPRDTSPADGSKEPAAASPPQKEHMLTKKKSNRVSFTDENTIVVHRDDESSSSSVSISLPSALPTAPEPPASAAVPPTHRRWFNSLGRGRKNDAAASLEDDQIMKPRPALPSFGSIRERASLSTKQPEERALMRPQSALPPAASETLQDQTTSSRNTANTSRYREPLPPVVTSVDGCGYNSDSDTSTVSNEDSEASQAGLATGATAPRPDEKHEEVEEGDDDITPIGTPAVLSSITSKRNAPLLPEISVTRASQESLQATESEVEGGAAAEAAKPSPTGSFFDVPGMFPADSDPDGTLRSGSSPTKAASTVPEPAAEDGDDSLAMQPAGTVLAAPMPTVLEEPGPNWADEDDTDTSIYSDAYEDLSDMEGDGFLSLNAVVESPIRAARSPLQPKSEKLAEQQKQSPPPSPSKSSRGPFSAGLVTRAAQVARADAGELPSSVDKPEMSVNQEAADQAHEEDDWEKVKAFWRSLSEEKRAQLELAAREEAGAEGDLEETTPEKRPRQKKSTETRAAEKLGLWADGEVQPSKAVLPRIRRSMREANSQAQPRETGQKKTNGPVSSAVSGAASSTVSLRRQGSDSSESSFKRSRGGDDGGSGGGFRKTMRRDSNASSEQNRSSRFSLRSLSPAGSTLRGSHIQSPESPQLRRSFRDSKTSKTAGGTMRTSLSPAVPTLRGPPKDGGEGGGLFSSVGRSSGSKLLLQRGKNGPSSRFGDSSDEDDDTLVGSGATGKRMSSGGGGGAVLSRFADSSDDDDDDDFNKGLVAATKNSSRHRMAASLRPTSAGGRGGRSLSRPLPEELEAEEAAAMAGGRRPGLASRRGVVSSASLPVASPGGRRGRLMRHNSDGVDVDGHGNMGTATLRRSRSGRGDMRVSSAALAKNGLDQQQQVQQMQQMQHRRPSSTSSFMSALRRKKNGGGVESVGYNSNGRLTESAARRDTDLERSVWELQAVRNSSDRDEDSSGKHVLGSGNVDDSNNRSWPLRGVHPGAGSYQTSVSAGAALDGSLSGRRKKKFPALRRMFRLDD